MFVGDFMRDTAHLSLEEVGAYVRLLNQCYASGRPIDLSEDQISRMCGATSDSDDDAVRYVLRSFFVKQDDGYHNPRADQELMRMEEHRTRLSEAGRRGGLKSAEARLQASLKRGRKPGSSISIPITNTISKSIPIPIPNGNTGGGGSIVSPGSGAPTEPPPPAKNKFSPFADQIVSCRPEFSRISHDHLANALHDFPEECWTPAVDDFVRDMVTSLDPPKNPVKVLRAYLSKAADNDGSSNGRRKKRTLTEADFPPAPDFKKLKRAGGAV